MTHFTSILCFKTTGGQTGITNTVYEAHCVPICASQIEKEQRVCLGWTSQMFPAPLRSAAADAPFNVQSLKRFAFVKGNRSIPVVFQWLLFYLLVELCPWRVG